MSFTIIWPCEDSPLKSITENDDVKEDKLRLHCYYIESQQDEEIDFSNKEESEKNYGSFGSGATTNNTKNRTTITSTTTAVTTSPRSPIFWKDCEDDDIDEIDIDAIETPDADASSGTSMASFDKKEEQHETPAVKIRTENPYFLSHFGQVQGHSKRTKDADRRNTTKDKEEEEAKEKTSALASTLVSVFRFIIGYNKDTTVASSIPPYLASNEKSWIESPEEEEEVIEFELTPTKSLTVRTEIVSDTDRTELDLTELYKYRQYQNQNLSLSTSRATNAKNLSMTQSPSTNSTMPSIPTNQSSSNTNQILILFCNCKTAADAIPIPFVKIILDHAKLSALGLCLVYLIFLTTWSPLYLLSKVIGESGVYLSIVGFLFKIGRSVLRLIAFPGASSKVSREIENEFAKYCGKVLQKALLNIGDFASIVLHFENYSSSKTATTTTTTSGEQVIVMNHDTKHRWQKAVYYKNHVIGMFSDILTCLLVNQGEGISNNTSDLDFELTFDTSSPVSEEQEEQSKTLRHRELSEYKNNKLMGHVGDLSSTTQQAKNDGKTLLDLLNCLLFDFKALEELLLVSEEKEKTPSKIRINEETIKCARKMQMTTYKLRDFVSFLSSAINSSSDSNNTDEEEGYNSSTSTNNTSNNNKNNTIHAIKSALFGELIPLLDKPAHSSIFGLDMLRGCLLSRYKGARQFYVQRPNNGGTIDAIHIPAPVKKSSEFDNIRKKRKAVLYCQPNAGFYEVSAGLNFLNSGNIEDGSTQDPSSLSYLGAPCWTDFYLQNGFDVYLFNYSGYGRSFGISLFGGKALTPSDGSSTGVFTRVLRIFYNSFFVFRPSPSTLKNDAFYTAQYIMNSSSQGGQTKEQTPHHLIIHGESIGGMAAASTARRMSNNNKHEQKHQRRRKQGHDFTLVSTTESNNVSMNEHELQQQNQPTLLICDRTFCNLPAVAQRLVGDWTAPIIKCLAPFWNTNVAQDFLFTKCPKVVCNDANDMIIADTSSLKSGLSIIKEIVKTSSSSSGSNNIHTVGQIWQPPLPYRMAELDGISISELSKRSKSRNSGKELIVNAPVWPVDKHISMMQAFHFAACVTRIGKVATSIKKKQQAMPSSSQMSGLRGIRSRDSDDVDDNNVVQDDEEEGVEMSLLGDHDIHNTSLNVNSPKKQQARDVSSNNNMLIIDVWNIIACIDGLCGMPLGFSVKNGLDCGVSWLCSTLTYGPQQVVKAAKKRISHSPAQKISIIPSDFNHGRNSNVFQYTHEETESEIRVNPTPIPEALERLKKYYNDNFLHNNNNAATFSPTNIQVELRFTIDMLEYMKARISSNYESSNAMEKIFHADSSHSHETSGSNNNNKNFDFSVGHFMNLHCGHNNMFSSQEKEYLRKVLFDLALVE